MFAIMPNRAVGGPCEYSRKIKHFPSKPSQSMGVALTIFIPFPNSLIRVENRFDKTGTANFGRNIPTGISGPPPEMITNIPARGNRNRPFHLKPDLNFRDLWHNEAPLGSVHTTRKFQNAALFPRLCQPSTLTRHENGAFRKLWRLNNV